MPKTVKRTIGRSTTQETPLHVRARGVELDAATRRYIRARVGFKLGKYALNLTRISVRIEDVAGPKGASTFACRVKLVLPGMREVVVSAEESGVRQAFDVAVDAAARAVGRVLGRTRRLRRTLPNVATDGSRRSA